MTIIGLALGIPLLILLVGIPWTWGMFDLYMAQRFAKHHKTDYSVAPLTWLSLKWMLLHNLDRIVEKLPFLKQDLSEILGVRPDDGYTNAKG